MYRSLVSRPQPGSEQFPSPYALLYTYYIQESGTPRVRHGHGLAPPAARAAVLGAPALPPRPAPGASPSHCMHTLETSSDSRLGDLLVYIDMVGAPYRICNLPRSSVLAMAHATPPSPLCTEVLRAFNRSRKSTIGCSRHLRSDGLILLYVNRSI